MCGDSKNLVKSFLIWNLKVLKQQDKLLLLRESLSEEDYAPFNFSRLSFPSLDAFRIVDLPLPIGSETTWRIISVKMPQTSILQPQCWQCFAQTIGSIAVRPSVPRMVCEVSHQFDWCSHREWKYQQDANFPHQIIQRTLKAWMVHHTAHNFFATGLRCCRTKVGKKSMPGADFHLNLSSGIATNGIVPISPSLCSSQCGRGDCWIHCYIFCWWSISGKLGPLSPSPLCCNGEHLLPFSRPC